MTEDGRERERRRRQNALRWLAYVVCMIALLAVRVGLVLALLGVLGMAVVLFGLVRVLVWRSRRAEAKRRAAGEPPSWSAQLPVTSALVCGADVAGRHGRSPTGELLGRLVYLGGELRWEPGPRDKTGTPPVTWDSSWSAEVTPVWGTAGQGCLTLTRTDGAAVDVWVRDPKDLSRTLGLGW